MCIIFGCAATVHTTHHIYIPIPIPKLTGKRLIVASHVIIRVDCLVSIYPTRDKIDKISLIVFLFQHRSIICMRRLCAGGAYVFVYIRRWVDGVTDRRFNIYRVNGLSHGDIGKEID